MKHLTFLLLFILCGCGSYAQSDCEKKIELLRTELDSMILRGSEYKARILDAKKMIEQYDNALNEMTQKLTELQQINEVLAEENKLLKAKK